MILCHLYNLSIEAKNFTSLIKRCNVTTDKILYQKRSDLYKLTKYVNIKLYAINVMR